MTTRTGARASPVVRVCPRAMDKFMDVLGDLPSDSSLTSSDEEDEGGRKNLASSKAKEVTYEDLVKRSYGSAVAAIDEDARRRRDDAKKASAAAKDGDDGKGKKRREQGIASDSDDGAPELIQNNFGNWELRGNKRVKREEEFLADAAARREARGPTWGEQRSAALKTELEHRMLHEEKFDLSRLVKKKDTD
ncbi:hypothetical protein N9M16_03590 [Candidatus Dependentiae bacterium]|nr:hypothetical protein [Candidatus Dependentiae bacterium]